MNNKFKKQLGQSLLEIVFSIGIIALVITGSVVLIVNSVGVKNNGFERKKATEMGEIIIEELIDQRRNSSETFWSLTSKTGETLPKFDGYTYSISYNNDGISCSDCTNAVVNINWGDDKSLVVSRFFSKTIN
jgi:hypothetical protein